MHRGLGGQDQVPKRPQQLYGRHLLYASDHRRRPVDNSWCRQRPTGRCNLSGCRQCSGSNITPPRTVLPPRGAITVSLKKPNSNRSDAPALTRGETAGTMLKTGLQNLADLAETLQRRVADVEACRTTCNVHQIS